MPAPVNYLETPFITPGDRPGAHRLTSRARHLIFDNAALIRGKRVLDLAGNDGRLGYSALAAGAAHLTLVEARPELTEAAARHYADLGVADRATLVVSDLFDFLEAAAPGDFDVILCFGFLYHTTRQVDFFLQMQRLRPETVIVDTSVARNYLWFGRRLFGKPPALFMFHEDPGEARNTTAADGIVMWPTLSFLEQIFDMTGYRPALIDYRRNGQTDWTAMQDYRAGRRVSMIGRRR